MKINKKDRERLLKERFNCNKGDVVTFKIDKKTFKGTVIDLVPKYEFPSNYFTEEVPDSRNKCYMWQDENGHTDSVLLRVMTGKKLNLPTYYTSVNISKIEE
jgi:hypothetical protein